MLGILISKRYIVILPILILTYLFFDKAIDKAQRIESSKARLSHMMAHDISYKIDLYNQILMKEKQFTKKKSDLEKIEESQQELYSLKLNLKSHDGDTLNNIKSVLEKKFSHLNFQTQAPELMTRISKANISMKTNELHYQTHEELAGKPFHKFIVKFFGIKQPEK